VNLFHYQAFDALPLGSVYGSRREGCVQVPCQVRTIVSFARFYKKRADIERKLTLAPFALNPPSLRRFATQGLLPVCWCWGVASLVLVCGSLRILID